MKVYKFRSLANCNDCKRIKIILKGKGFWCSQFSKLNDPMEGAFISESKFINKIIDVKNKYKICSFSGEKGFKNPCMWGYYANGFKGIAIEVEIDEKYISEIKYDKNVCNNIQNDKCNIEEILTTKLPSWKHENEYRFLTKNDGNFHRIGQITAVFFGDPYGTAYKNNNIFENNNDLICFLELRKCLQEFLINKGIISYFVKIKNNKVVSKK